MANDIIIPYSFGLRILAEIVCPFLTWTLFVEKCQLWYKRFLVNRV